MVGVVSLFAVTVMDADVLQRLPQFGARMRWFLANKHGFLARVQSAVDDLGSALRHGAPLEWR